MQERWQAGLPSLASASGAEASGPDDISFLGLGGAYVTTGLGLPPAARDQLGPDATLLGRLSKLSASGELKEVADLASFEAMVNPDGGLLDTNPYGVLALPGRQVVADAGANAVLQVDANGHVSPLAAFGRRPNPLPIGAPFVEPVPTAVAHGPYGALCISELTG